MSPYEMEIHAKMFMADRRRSAERARQAAAECQHRRNARRERRATRGRSDSPARLASWARRLLRLVA